MPGRRERRVVWSAAVAVLLTTTFLPARFASGQTTGRGSGNAAADLTLAGTISSSITISVTGSVNQNGGATTVITGNGTQGIVDFGTYNIPGPLLTGEKQRVNSNPKGTYLVATLTVTTTFSGGGSMLAAVDIQRANPCGPAPDVACGAPGALFYAFQIPRKPKQRASWPAWSAYPESRYGASVLDVPSSTYIPGAGNLDNQMANGDSVDHQVAIWIPDSLPPGPFATVVTYTATRL